MTIAHPLDGATAIITGAGSGIGQAIALAFAARGARVAVSDRDGNRAEATAALVTGAGGSAWPMVVDVAKDEDFAALRETTLREFGQIDIVVNNVGVIAMGPPESLPVEAWQHVLDLNLISLARSNCTFLPLLVAQGRGHVVNIASASGLLAYGFDRLPYVASKHAMVGASEAMARYLAPCGVGVTVACPSGVETNIVEQITFYGSASATPRAPDHRIVSAQHVGELVANAVENGTYLVLTEPAIRDELIEKARDPEQYLQTRIAELTR